MQNPRHTGATRHGTDGSATAGVILAVEPDPTQAAAIRRLVRDHLQADLVLVDTRDAAVVEIDRRVPDLILVTALLSPRDEDELVAHLRTMAAAHLQLLTIPQLARLSQPEEDRPRGLLGSLRRRRPPRPEGCDPTMFAGEIRTYLARARDVREQHEYERRRRAGEVTDWQSEGTPADEVALAPEVAAGPPVSVSDADELVELDSAVEPVPPEPQPADAEAAVPDSEPAVEPGIVEPLEEDPLRETLAGDPDVVDGTDEEPAAGQGVNTEAEAPVDEDGAGFRLEPPGDETVPHAEADPCEDAPASPLASEDERALPFEATAEADTQPATWSEETVLADMQAQAAPRSLADELDAALRARTDQHPGSFFPVERPRDAGGVAAFLPDGDDDSLDFLAGLDAIMEETTDVPPRDAEAGGLPTRAGSTESAEDTSPPADDIDRWSFDDDVNRLPVAADPGAEADDEVIARLTRQLLGRDPVDASLDLVVTSEPPPEAVDPAAPGSTLPTPDHVWLFSAIDELKADLQQMRTTRAGRIRPPAPPRLIPLAAWAYRADETRGLSRRTERDDPVLPSRARVEPLPVADVAYGSGGRIRRLRIRRKRGRRRRSGEKGPLIIVSREALEAARAADEPVPVRIETPSSVAVPTRSLKNPPPLPPVAGL